MIKKLMVILGMVTFGGVFAHAGNETGSGGDPLRLLFDDARKAAISRVESVMPCAFSTDVRLDVRDWILKNQTQLANDIAQSNHIWITDQQATCAWTQLKSTADITLSFVSCRPHVDDISDAVRILVHESVHHFGIDNEQFPDEVAQAIGSLGRNSTCPVSPSKDPFDPASCPGTPFSKKDLMSIIPLPNKNEIQLGSYQVFSRNRTCYSEQWCTPWAVVSDYWSLYNATRQNGAYRASRGGTIAARFSNNEPSIFLRSDEYAGPMGKRRYYLEAKINGYSLNTIYDGTPDGYIKVSLKDLKNNMKGWITNSCMRQTITGSRQDRDNLGNNIVIEYETVFLSHYP